MNRLFAKALSAVVLAGSILVLSGCPGSDSATDPMKVQLGKLSKTWTMISPGGAYFNGTSDDRSAAFAGFKLQLSGTFDKNSPKGPYSFEVVSGSMQDPSPWYTPGTWSFAGVDKGSDSGSIIREEDQVGMTYFINSSGQLVLTFECADCDYPGAKTATVNGTWQFTFQ